MDNTSTTEELTTTTCKSGFDLNMIDVTAIMQKNCSAYRVLHTKQNEAWIFDGVNSTLKLNDDKLVEKKTLGLTFHLCDMTLTPSQDIIATDHHNKHIKKILPSGSVSTLCSTAPLIPGGICINRRQQLVVGLRRDWRTPPVKLVIYSSDGSAVLQEIEIDEDGNPLFRMEITQVKQNGDGHYVVADRHRVVCVSSEGRLRWEYDIGLFTGIYGIVCDKYDDVIIAEYYNKNILLLSSEGKLVTTLLTEEDGISKPRSLSIDRHGQLWIGQDRRIKVFSYLK